jgi:predicted component of type VI protein secretion system
MFENFSPAVKIALERTIQETIELFEPRVRLISVIVNETRLSNDLVINIVFTLRNTEVPITLTTLLSRVR